MAKGLDKQKNEKKKGKSLKEKRAEKKDKKKKQQSQGYKFESYIDMKTDSASESNMQKVALTALA